jgi:hypothetical protein
LGRYLNPVVIIGSFLAIASGIVSYFAGGDNLVLGVVVGLQVQILTLAVEILLTVKAREIAAGRLAHLVAGAESVGWLSDILARICEAAVAVHDKYRGTIAPDAARRLLSTTDRDLKELAGGVMYVDCFDLSIKLQLLGGPPSILRTMSVQSHDLRWHLSDVGRNYWAAQKAALDKGWTIRRIFVYDDWVSELSDLAMEQKTAGVDVRRVRRSDLPFNLRTLDATIWGDSHAFEHRQQLAGGTIDRFTVARDEISRYSALFNNLEIMSQRVENTPPSR